VDVLIIGGTRYMGKVTVERLLARGDRVTVFSRGSTRPPWWDQVTHIYGDRNDQPDFSSKLKSRPFDAVIDTQAYKWEDVESAVRTLRGNVGRYLLVSTSSVYLEGKVDFFHRCPYNEADLDWSQLEYTYPLGEDPYAVGKRHCEKWLMENGDIPYTIIRIPAVMGPDDPTGRMWWWVQRALDGGRLVIPTNSLGAFRTLYYADAADNFIRVMDTPQAVNQTYFIGMPEIMTIERWAYLVWQVAGNDLQIAYVPPEIIAKNNRLRNYSPPLSRPIPNIHDLSKANRDIGITTTPVAEWVQETVAWYRDSYRGPDSEGYRYRDEELSIALQWNQRYQQLVSEF
jgi:2'-hydroxyisoflavone reductase